MSINRKRGSIALARSLCYQINGAADDSDDMDGNGYGSVDVAEILSAEIERLQQALAQPVQEPVREALKLALGALEEAQTTDDSMQKWDRNNKAIKAIKEALAPPQLE